MLKSLDHIAIAVKDADKARELFCTLLGGTFLREETVASQGVRTVIIDIGGIHVELLEAVGPDTPVGKFLDKRGEGLHHITFTVDDIAASLKELKEKGVVLVNETPVEGVGGSRVAFLHPKSVNGVLLEIKQQSGADNND